jgi:hypothetical protein
VSHNKERKEKNCLNCGAQVHGRYCHICGQENIDTHETLWGVITHFVYDITHFDGKFFSTLKFLLLKPGFLSQEYMRGRRASYLHPIKMYVFTSAVFFFVFFAMRNEEDYIKADESDVVKERTAVLKQLVTASDPGVIDSLKKELQISDTAIVQLEEMKMIEKDPSIPDSVRAAIRPYLNTHRKNVNLVYFEGMPATEAKYDSMQQSLPPAKRDGWLKHYIIKKNLQLNAKFQYDSKTVIKAVISKFLHSLPKMMFISLPFVAVFISLLYMRQRHSNYVHHAILAIHNYIAMYIFILLTIVIGALQDKLNWQVLIWILAALQIYIFYYNYKSLRNFFGQRRGRTIFKFAILSFMVMILFALLSAVFVINSLLSI